MNPNGKTVAILGGGVGGMCAAHMLARRGFSVTVYEAAPVYVGGKARSVDVPGTEVPCDDKPLPGEHGFRFFPGFYRHIFDTMKEIPLPQGGSAFDNLVATDTVQLSQIGKCPVTLPLELPSSPTQIIEFVKALQELSGELTDEEVEFFAARLWQLMTSCDERFMSDYEGISWWEYTAADNYSEAYRQLLVQGLTRSLVAAKANVASTRTIGMMFTQLLYTMIDGEADNTDRVLNSPTNDAWLNPWLDYLLSIGVDYHHGQAVSGIRMESDSVRASIASVEVTDVTTGTVLPAVTADYYVLAVPVDVAGELISASPELLSADPSLRNVVKLAGNVEWMNGIQFFLSEEFARHRGHTIYAGSNWALTSISQLQFWPDYDMSDRYCGRARAILSVDISDWSAPGNFNGKPARACTRQEVIDETWQQLKQEINSCDEDLLTDEMLVFAYLDSSIYVPTVLKEDPDKLKERLGGLRVAEDDGVAIRDLENKEPMLVNLINSWSLRPSAYTNVPNLFLAADYVSTHTDLACMEGADEAARRATNSILDVSGSDARACRIWPFESPFPLPGFQALDRWRWKRGLEWKNPLSLP